VSINISLSGQITVSDGTTGTVSLQKQITAAMVVGSAFSEVQSLNVGTGSVSLILPIAVVQFIYIKNLHATQFVSITWTTVASGSSYATTLEPGSVIVISEATVGGGVTAISLQASGTGTPVEFILGG
jgi:hypothetical protein